MAAPGLEQAGGVGLLGLPAVESLGGFETADLYPIPQLLGNNGQVGNISVMLPLACFNAIALKNKLFFDPGLCPRMALCQSCANQPLFRLLFLPWLCRPFDPPTTKLPWDAAGDLSAI